MEIILTKANIKDATIIHKMQLIAFKPLLDKYHDYDISPGAESIEKVEARLQQSFTDYYLISLNGEYVGAIRILLKDKDTCRISPIFILPQFQNKGIAQKVFSIIENMYQPACGWELDTILEEKGNCYLYEKMGYKKTGKYVKISEHMNIVFYEKKMA